MAPFPLSPTTLLELLTRCGPAAVAAAALTVVLPGLLWQTAQRMLFRRQARALPLRFLRGVRAGGGVTRDVALCRRLLANHLRTLEDHVRAGGPTRLSAPCLSRRTAAMCTVLTTVLAGYWGAAGLLCGQALVAAAVVVRVAAAYVEAATALRGSLRQFEALLDSDDPERGAALLRVVLEADQGVLDIFAPTGTRPTSSTRVRRGRSTGRRTSR
ncbi:hypothetical protein ACIGW3_01340 [Streptomyces sp. NPDC053499]|uniref:hypothetical protein n=1 Tax=Streptomyces sp. NPDC053499 TaxID=3365707 RepID=UPI0037D78D3C